MARKEKQPVEPAAVGVLIPAAGASARMRSKTSKILADLGGKPVIMHSIDAFDSMPEVGEIVVATSKDIIDSVAELVRGRKKISVVPGGPRRQDSVIRAFGSLGKNSRLVAVHDAARPLATVSFIRRIFNAAARHGSAVPGLPPAATVKEVCGRGLTKNTLDRNRLRLVQTPQVFERGLFEKAVKRAIDSDATFTDDAAMVEATGRRVKIVAGDKNNFKITFPNDLQYAEHLLARR